MITRVLTLVAYTALPIVGVLWLGWDWREIVLLYWLENISLGVAMFVTLLRVARATPMPTPTPVATQTPSPASEASQASDAVPAPPASQPAPAPAATPEAQPTPTSSTPPTLDPTTHPVGGILFAFFFATHYGMFTFVHGFFVIVLITGGLGPIAVDSRPLNVGGVLLVWAAGGLVQVAAAVIGALPTQRGSALMMSAYPRIVVLHLTIILGVFAIIILGWGAAAAIVLIAIHAAITIGSWMLSDRRTENPPAPATVGLPHGAR